MERYDVIVVGAGSSGGVVAARLTETPDCRVLLIEAGPDFPNEEAVPPLFTLSGEHSWKTAGVPEFDWDLVNTDRSGTLGGRVLRLPRGRLMGGTSMVNATIAARGAPFDYDRWAAMGNPGWAWADLLPLFIRIENDLDFGDQPIHGKDGPIVIQRYRPESWAPVNRVMYEACVELGVREAPDLNGLDAHAGVVGAMPHNRYKEVRLGTLVTYLRTARHRPNLTIRAGATVDRVMLSGGKAEGVAYIDCAGQAGDGACRPGRDQRRRLQQPGDPAALGDRTVGLAAAARHQGRGRPAGRTQSARPSGLRHDVQGQGPRRDDRPQLRRRRARAGRPDGRAGLADPSGAGRRGRRHRLLLDLSDAPAGAGRGDDPEHRSAAAAIDRPPLQHARARPPEFRRRPRASARRCWRPQTFQRHGAEWIDDLDRPIAEALAAGMGAAHHQAGSVKMGPAGDPTAVVGADLRVHGFDNLRVADTSIYPDNVMHNTNLTALVVGEKTAEIVAAALGGGG